jgi:hypothetical protein
MPLLQDPWTIRHPFICRFLLIPVSLVILLALLMIPAVDPHIRSVYSGTILKQITVFSTLLFIRILPFSEDSIHEVIRVVYLIAVFALPQLFYSYHYHRKPREAQAVWMLIGFFAVTVFCHAQLCKSRYAEILQVYHNGNPISEKDLYKIVGAPLYWRHDMQYKQYGYYTDGSMAVYIYRNEKGHFEVETPYLWINSAP